MIQITKYTFDNYLINCSSNDNTMECHKIYPEESTDKKKSF